jgi:hypothetical protein
MFYKGILYALAVEVNPAMQIHHSIWQMGVVTSGHAIAAVRERYTAMP